MDEKYNFESEKKVFDTFAEWQEFAYKNSLTDGAIVAPPEKQKVVEILDYLGRNPDESIGKLLDSLHMESSFFTQSSLGSPWGLASSAHPSTSTATRVPKVT